MDKVTCGDCLNVLRKLPDECIDAFITDPPYGTKYKGATDRWDDHVPRVRVWKEGLRVMKPGAFAFVMSSPRQDLLAKMILNLQKAGFVVSFTSIWYTYKNGFCKASNTSKCIDRRLRARPKVIRVKRQNGPKFPRTEQEIHNGGYNDPNRRSFPITRPASKEAKAFEQARGGFQPKPMLEAIIVAMKPLSEKSFVGQALKNGKGVTFIGSCKIPDGQYSRLPGNLLVSDDDAMNDERTRNRRPHDGGAQSDTHRAKSGRRGWKSRVEVEGIFPRCSNLDAWFKEKFKKLPESVRRTFPFLIVSKPSKKEKNQGLEKMPDVVSSGLPLRDGSENYVKNEYGDGSWSTRKTLTKNYHPCVKPLKLCSFLVTLATRPNDVVLDCYLGQGSTALACQMLKRHFVGIEINREYCKIAEGRLAFTRKYVQRSIKWKYRCRHHTFARASSSLQRGCSASQARKHPIPPKNGRSGSSPK